MTAVKSPQRMLSLCLNLTTQLSRRQGRDHAVCNTTDAVTPVRASLM